MANNQKKDIFLSHASEDKDTFVDELHQRLCEVNYTVWYDKYELKWGDNLKTKITEGLNNSKYGIVVISKNYFATHKEWTFMEFEQILTTNKILPILHNINMQVIKENHPGEHEKIKNWVAISSKGGIDHIIEQALNVIGNRWSEKNINYTKLRNHLANKEWREADQETYEVMIKAVGKKSGDWFTSDELLNFPCKDLRTIDQLWVKYSGGLFGFSVQRKIHLRVGGKSDGKYYQDADEYYQDAWEKYYGKKLSLNRREFPIPVSIDYPDNSCYDSPYETILPSLNIYGSRGSVCVRHVRSCLASRVKCNI